MNLYPGITQDGVIDSHAHVMKEYFKEEQTEVIERAFENKVRQMVNPAVTVEDFEELKALSEKYEHIYIALGQHPHDAKTWQPDYEKRIVKASEYKKLVAIGECGLDFYYDNSERAIQLEVFRKQVRLAKSLKKPLIVHCRDAWQETFDILEEEADKHLKGVFHCFTGGPELIDRVKQLDFYVSYSGIVTFKNAIPIQESVELVPEERILVETDCPFLAPQQVRGQRNEPVYVWWTVEKLAQLKHSTVESLAGLCSKNARTLFDLPEPT